MKNKFIKKSAVVIGLVFTQLIAPSLLCAQEKLKELTLIDEELKLKIDYLVQNRFKGRGEIINEMPIISIKLLIEKLNSNGEGSRHIGYYSLLVSKFKQFESELKEPELSTAIDTLISKRMSFDDSIDIISSIRYQESILSYWTQIQHPRIKIAYQKWRQELDVIRAEAAAAERARLGLPNSPIPIPTPTPLPQADPTPFPTRKPTIGPSAIPTQPPTAVSTSLDSLTWPWMAALLVCLSLIGWFLKRMIKS